MRCGPAEGVSTSSSCDRPKSKLLSSHLSAQLATAAGAVNVAWTEGGPCTEPSAKFRRSTDGGATCGARGNVYVGTCCYDLVAEAGRLHAIGKDFQGMRFARSLDGGDTRDSCQAVGRASGNAPLFMFAVTGTEAYLVWQGEGFPSNEILLQHGR